jgi:1,4-alpha-glucan branching enzyme
MSIKKKFPKGKSSWKVTFRVPEEIGVSAQTAHVVGEFNGWDYKAAPMRKLKSGAFSISLDLEQGKEYQFRYLLDNNNWQNDIDADKFVATPYGDSKNSVIVL